MLTITFPCQTVSGMNVREHWQQEELDLLRAAYSPDKPASAVNLTALALALGRHKTNVCRKARELGLTNQRRPMVPPEELQKRVRKFDTVVERSAYQSQERKQWLASNPHPRGALGMKHSDQAKAAIQEKALARWAAMTRDQRDEHVFKQVKGKRDKGIPFANPRGSWKAGWREVGPQRCFFRSRWEANYARYLEWLRGIGEIVSWEHEAHTFWFEGIRRGCVSYLPDFKVTEKGGAVHWHEVKGWMDARSKTVISRMAKYHPQEVLVVIQEKQYREIERKVSTLIAGWEVA